MRSLNLLRSACLRSAHVPGPITTASLTAAETSSAADGITHFTVPSPEAHLYGRRKSNKRKKFRGFQARTACPPVEDGTRHSASQATDLDLPLGRSSIAPPFF
ncbi:unnamed protein product [Protopolystoma xenopodis]|uniref:Uncharacterized protein n=1 Tax=Protopolystoma xenopodis TaxID=117903 RepID=A0A3S5CGH0_9PLAT|nr:unnamed protein product [Protopolystoma xenopodis]